MNAANVAQLNFFFLREAKFVDEKMDEKSKFGELSTKEEIQEIMDNAVPITTQKATKLAMRLFNVTYQLSFP